MRSLSDKELPTVSGTEFSQIVVPKLAHDIPATAHLGMSKTKKRFEQHFYWPSMSEDIKLYVRTCDVCQRLGKGIKLKIAIQIRGKDLNIMDIIATV